MKAFRGVEQINPVGPMQLEARFRGDRRIWRVDLAQWIEAVPVLEPLRDPSVFAGVRLLDDGFTLEWVPDELDMGGDQLWRLAGEQAGELMPTAEFRAWRRRHDLSLTGAAELLGISRRLVAYYDSGERAVPKTIQLACEGWEARQAKRAARPLPASVSRPAWPASAAGSPAARRWCWAGRWRRPTGRGRRAGRSQGASGLPSMDGVRAGA
jgi:hypothetical protein